MITPEAATELETPVVFGAFEENAPVVNAEGGGAAAEGEEAMANETAANAIRKKVLSPTARPMPRQNRKRTDAALAVDEPVKTDQEG